jgi:hypothetical protein
MTQQSYYGRLGQAIIQTDYYASAVKKGGAIPTVFHLTNGQWKMVVPGTELIKLPLFHTTKYYNKFCKGNVLKSGLETEASIPNYGGATEKLDAVGCHVYAREDHFGILLCSRDFENDLMVQLNLPDDLQLIAPEKAMIYTLTGDGFSSRELVVDSMAVTISDGMLINVPKHSMVVVSFGADGSNVEDVPMGFLDGYSSTGLPIFDGDQDENDAALKSGLKIYPNPASYFLRIEGIPEGAGPIQISDSMGRICLTQSCGGKVSSVDLSSLEPGIYSLRIAKNREVFISSFIRE